jgi:hypothetical protein
LGFETLSASRLRVSLFNPLVAKGGDAVAVDRVGGTSVDEFVDDV